MGKKEYPSGSRKIFDAALGRHDVWLMQAYDSAPQQPVNPLFQYKSVVPYSMSIHDIPDDIRMYREEQLNRKLHEYEERMMGKLSPFEEVDALSPKYIYRRDILRLVLSGRTVSVRTLAGIYSQKYADMPEEELYDAMGVVADYIKTGGENVILGSGLPPIK